MIEMTFEEWQRAWAMAMPRGRYDANPSLTDPRELMPAAQVDGYVMPLPRGYRDICSPAGLASLFVGLKGEVRCA